MESSNHPTEARHCQDCGNQLRGRSDQRFCNDTCRNHFNRKKRQEIAERIPVSAKEILRIIKNNYRILSVMSPNPEYEIIVDLHELQSKGVNFKFFTSITYKDGESWYCIFDIGWRAVDEQVLITTFPDQAKVEDHYPKFS
ncbi:DUF2116 family Zn-ribbon domain-containing protein [Olivibacter sp. XZL3]|uniref:DUF2116 family Zn-ribbon domain-containing protein n=1 Tax=Olivibacter sp. XZL3 TaxID=1735116 RepID=UPI00106553B6|nr:DUF2116 family Zn-ribbon domain-containing protein [Olivibacter sp. XZL3]